MSYILDALKKSEKERQRKSLPDILTVQNIVSEKPARSGYWAYLITAALLINAGIITWWLSASHTIKGHAHQTPKADSVPASPVKVMTQSYADGTKPSTDSALPLVPQLKRTEENSVSGTRKIAQAQPERASHLPLKTQAIQDVRRKIMFDLPDPVSVIPVAPDPAPEIIKQPVVPTPLPTEQASLHMDIPDKNRIYKLRELPSAILKGLPTFAVSAFLYAENPASRVVRINEQMMHEGQELTPGIRLEEITRDGLVFSYHKFRFFVGAK